MVASSQGRTPTRPVFSTRHTPHQTIDTYTQTMRPAKAVMASARRRGAHEPPWAQRRREARGWRGGASMRPKVMRREQTIRAVHALAP